MNECLTTPQLGFLGGLKLFSLLLIMVPSILHVCEVNEKQIGYWVSEKGKCISQIQTSTIFIGTINHSLFQLAALSNITFLCVLYDCF